MNSYGTPLPPKNKWTNWKWKWTSNKLNLYDTSSIFSNRNDFSKIFISGQASLIGHMDKLHLLEPSTIFLEFGAGRGKFMFV